MTSVDVPSTALSHQRLDVGWASTNCLVGGPLGRDTPILLLHDGAWGASAEASWGSVFSTLRRVMPDRRIIAPDMLGFGWTSKIVGLDTSPYDLRMVHVAELLKVLGVSGGVHVVGTSFGGSMALQLLATRPQLVASVMSLSGTGGPWRSEFGRRSLECWDGTRDRLTEIVQLLAENSDEFSIDEHVNIRLESASQRGHFRSMAAPGTPLPDVLKKGPSHAWPEPLQGSPVPVMLLHGSRDPLVEPDWFEHLQKSLKNSQVVVHDFLHSPNLDHPTWVAGQITQWTTAVEGRQ